jgi:hypothetical protein
VTLPALKMAYIEKSEIFYESSSSERMDGTRAYLVKIVPKLDLYDMNLNVILKYYLNRVSETEENDGKPSYIISHGSALR